MEKEKLLLDHSLSLLDGSRSSQRSQSVLEQSVGGLEYSQGTHRALITMVVPVSIQLCTTSNADWIFPIGGSAQVGCRGCRSGSCRRIRQTSAKAKDEYTPVYGITILSFLLTSGWHLHVSCWSYILKPGLPHRPPPPSALGSRPRHVVSGDQPHLSFIFFFWFFLLFFSALRLRRDNNAYQCLS